MNQTDIVSLLFQSLALALGSVITWAIKNKAKVDMTKAQEEVLTGIINSAVGSAEEAARKHKSVGSPLNSVAKLNTAKEFIDQETKRLNLPKVPEHEMEKLIHAQLGVARIKYKAPPLPTPTTSGTTIPKYEVQK